MGYFSPLTLKALHARAICKHESPKVHVPLQRYCVESFLSLYLSLIMILILFFNY